jgi:methionine sulfoxide reductase heme-binding subunit
MKARRIALSVTGPLLAAGAWCLLSYRGDGDAYDRALALTRACGWIALLALCAALCMTPLRQVLRFAGVPVDRALNALRRALGIAAAIGALAHAALSLGWVPGTRALLLNAPQLRAGLCALVILVPLLATSFRPLLRTWKELHRMAYVAAPFALLHVVLGPFAPLRAALALAAFTFACGLLRALPARTGEPRDQP